jgi:potassium efflux system protein
MTHNDRKIDSYGYILIIAILFFFSAANWAGAEESTKSPSLIQPINISDIPARAAAQRASLDQSEALLARSSVFDQIEKDLLTGDQAITQGLVSLRPSLAVASSRQAISEIEHNWLDLDRQMADTESMLNERTGVIQLQVSRLETSLELWKQSVEQAHATKAPDEIAKLARATVDDVSKIFGSLQQLQNRVLALQGKVGRAHRAIKEALDIIKAEEDNLLHNLTRRERPSLWSEAIVSVSMHDLVNRAGSELGSWWTSLVSVVSSEIDRVVFQIILLLVAATTLQRARKAARAWSAENPSIALGMAVFERPFSIATLLALMLTPWLYVSTAPALADAMGLILVLPVLWLVIPLLGEPIRPALLFLGFLYVVDWLRDLVDAAPLVARYIFIIEMIAAVVLIIWLIRSKVFYASKELQSASPWQGPIRMGLSVAVFLVVISTLAATAGFVRLAVLIGYGVLNSAYLALLLTALVRAGDAIIALTLHSRVAQAINIIRTRSQILRRRIKNLLIIIALFVWAMMTLDLFAAWDYVVIFCKGILFSELHTGAIVVSLADVLSFCVTIVAAVMLARAIIIVLDEDVYPRVELGRGVSFAISAVIKYGIIVIGFLLAVGAMGIGMDRITILLGAFGVGLGFGLQTIVNNFVSGMILIFERPIQLGDSIEIGSVKGKITRIGIRSSTVRSFEGADITVPNGNLLSDALTNWTMTDRNRRIEITVGVAYGTDPDKVIEVLQLALVDQDGILKEPAAQIIFNGFGDSSLDFALRAWAADNDNVVSLRSKIALAMNRALTDNGIEIPFPQRDLHLRSISPDVQLPGTV